MVEIAVKGLVVWRCSRADRIAEDLGKIAN